MSARQNMRAVKAAPESVPTFDRSATGANEPDIGSLKLPRGYVLRRVEDLGRMQVARLALSAVVEMCSSITNAGGTGSSLGDVNASNFACLLDMILRDLNEVESA